MEQGLTCSSAHREPAVPAACAVASPARGQVWIGRGWPRDGRPEIPVRTNTGPMRICQASDLHPSPLAVLGPGASLSRTARWWPLEPPHRPHPLSPPTTDGAATAPPPIHRFAKRTDGRLARGSAPGLERLTGQARAVDGRHGNAVAGQPPHGSAARPLPPRRPSPPRHPRRPHCRRPGGAPVPRSPRPGGRRRVI